MICTIGINQQKNNCKEYRQQSVLFLFPESSGILKVYIKKFPSIMKIDKGTIIIYNIKYQKKYRFKYRNEV